MAMPCKKNEAKLIKIGQNLECLIAISKKALSIHQPLHITKGRLGYIGTYSECNKEGRGRDLLGIL